MEDSFASARPASEATIGKMLWRRKGVLLLFLLVGLGTGYWYFSKQPEVYRAVSMVEIFQRRTETGTGSAVEKVVSELPGISYIRAELMSDQVLSEAIRVGQLTALENCPKDIPSCIGFIRGNLEVNPAVRDSESKLRTIVQVGFIGPDPNLAPTIVNSVVDSYSSYLQDRHNSNVSEIIEFFRGSRETLLKNLDEIESEYQVFRNSAPLTWSADGSAINPHRERSARLDLSIAKIEDQLRDLNGKLSLAAATMKSETSAIAALTEIHYLVEADLRIAAKLDQPEVSNTGDIQTLKARLLNLELKADLVRREFAERHPHRSVVESELESTRAMLMEAEGRQAALDGVERKPEVDLEGEARNVLRTFVNGLRSQIDVKKADRDRLLLEQQELEVEAGKLVAFENDNASFLRRIERYQTLLDTYDDQVQKANLPTVNSGLEMRVLRPATMGGLAGPFMTQILGVSGFAGFLLGAVIALMLEYSERSFRNPEEIDHLLNAPILANLPIIEFGKVNSKKKGGGDAVPVDPSLFMVHQSHGAAAEGIRSVRTGLLLEQNEGQGYQIIQVTSSVPGDGKSTVLANLGASLAAAGRRTLILDADLRCPVQDNLFMVGEKSRGITNVLNSECGLEDAIYQTALKNLFLLPSGTIPTNPSEALTLPAFEKTLDELRTKFDFILVDSPPVLAVSDTIRIAGYVDGLIFVLRIGRNAKPLAQRAMSLIRMAKANVIGAVVNAVGENAFSSQYANAYANAYGIGGYGYGGGNGYSRYLKANASVKYEVNSGSHGSAFQSTQSGKTLKPKSVQRSSSKDVNVESELL